MATYLNLELEHYYLIKETEDAAIMLVQPVMETANCLLILQLDEVETTFWKKKADAIVEIIEELTWEQVTEYEDLFEDDDDNWSFEEADQGWGDDGGEEDDLEDEDDVKEQEKK